MGVPSKIDSGAWTGLRDGANAPSTRPVPSPFIMTVVLFGSGWIVAWLPQKLLLHFAWKRLGSPIFFDELNGQAIAITLAAGIAAALLCLARGRFLAAFTAGLAATIASAITQWVQMDRAVDHPMASVIRPYFVQQSREPVYFGGRVSRAHWEWEWQVLTPSFGPERILVANALGAKATAGDTCLIARVDADSPVRIVRLIRLVSAGDGSGSYLNADANMARCFAMK
ncbi:MAG: hypothetical protein ABIR77_08405 [Sphingomicrobium sp.]